MGQGKPNTTKPPDYSVAFQGNLESFGDERFLAALNGRIELFRELYSGAKKSPSAASAPGVYLDCAMVSYWLRTRIDGWLNSGRRDGAEDARWRTFAGSGPFVRLALADFVSYHLSLSVEGGHLTVGFASAFDDNDSKWDSELKSALDDMVSALGVNLDDNASDLDMDERRVEGGHLTVGFPSAIDDNDSDADVDNKGSGLDVDGRTAYERRCEMRAFSLASRIFMWFCFSGWRWRLAKCRRPECGRYFWLKHWNRTYRRGTYCPRCARTPSKEAALAATAQARAAAEGELHRLVARKFGKSIARDTRWHTDQKLRTAVVRHLNSQIRAKASLRRVYGRGITGKWLSWGKNWSAIEKAAKGGANAKSERA